MIDQDKKAPPGDAGKPDEIADDTLDAVVGGLKKSGGDDLDDLQVERRK